MNELSYYTNPVEGWSKRWEYMFTYQTIENNKRKEKTVIVEIGSGFTFFPYFLIKKMGVMVEYLGTDLSQKNIFEKINYKTGAGVHFGGVYSDDKIPLGDSSVDILYIVSLTNPIENMSNEIYRVLKEGGIFIITFQFGLPSTNAPYKLEDADHIIEHFREKFEELPGDEEKWRTYNEKFTNLFEVNYMAPIKNSDVTFTCNAFKKVTKHDQ